MNLSREGRRACCALVLSLALPAGAALAEDASGKVEIGTVDIQSLLDLSVQVVTRRTERASEAPAAVFVLTADDIRRHGFRTLDEVLGSVPGLFSYPGRFPQVGVRGMGILGDFTTRLLVLVDGHPLNNAVGVDLARGLPVPLGAIQRVEVIKGPVGSVYGPSAFFGAVNLVTAGARPGGEAWAGAEVAQGVLRAGEASGSWRGAGDDLEGLASFDVYSSRTRVFTLPEAAGTPTTQDLDFGDAANGYARASWRGLDASGACGHSYGGLPTMAILDSSKRSREPDLLCGPDLAGAPHRDAHAQAAGGLRQLGPESWSGDPRASPGHRPLPGQGPRSLVHCRAARGLAAHTDGAVRPRLHLPASRRVSALLCG